MGANAAFEDETAGRLDRVLGQWLPEWREWITHEPSFAPGSALDVQRRTYQPGSALAWHSICNAVDHLSAIKTLWLDASRLYTFSDATTTRTALLSASTALYLLDDSPDVDARERLRRAALASLADHKDHAQHLEQLRTLVQTLGVKAEAEHHALEVEVQGWIVRAKQVARDHGATADQVKSRSPLAASTCVRTAADYVARDATEGDAVSLRAGVLTVWQRGGASAHGRIWQLLTMRRPDGSPYVQTHLGELANGVVASALILNEAWRLWDQAVSAPA